MNSIKRLRKLVWNIVNDIFYSGCIGYAKEAAYSFMLSFFPMLIFAITFFAKFGYNYKTEIINNIQRVMPYESSALVNKFVTEILQSNSTEVLLISGIITIIPASALMGTFSKALDVIYENKNIRSFWFSQMISFLLVIIIGIPLLIATLATAAGIQFENVVIQWMGDKKIFGIAWFIGRWIGVMLTVTSISALLYRIAPSKTPPWKDLIPGAIFSSILWILSTLAFGSYVSNFNSYNRIYGSLGAGIVLLVWMFVTSFVLLTGAIFNRQYELSYSRNVSRETFSKK